MHTLSPYSIESSNSPLNMVAGVQSDPKHSTHWLVVRAAQRLTRRVATPHYPVPRPRLEEDAVLEQREGRGISFGEAFEAKHYPV